VTGSLTNYFFVSSIIFIDPHSLDNLDHWRREFLQHVGGSGLGDLDPSIGTSSFPFVVLGNKMDKVRTNIWKGDTSRKVCFFSMSNRRGRLMFFLVASRPLGTTRTSGRMVSSSVAGFCHGYQSSIGTL